MQEAFVYLLIGGALFYIGVRFLGGKKSSHCDNCDAAPDQSKKNL